MKPFSQACENNQGPILERLGPFFADRRLVLEVGSGTGQHAVYFAERLPHLVWQCADLEENHVGIRAWLNDAKLANIKAPLAIDADLPVWNVGRYDAVFSANTLHIMAWSQVRRTFQHLNKLLLPNAKLAIYGPFNYDGKFTSESNANFDRSLKQRVAHMGIRDFEAVNDLAVAIGLELLADHAMPANNRLLCWQRTA